MLAANTCHGPVHYLAADAAEPAEPAAAAIEGVPDLNPAAAALQRLGHVQPCQGCFLRSWLGEALSAQPCDSGQPQTGVTGRTGAYWRVRRVSCAS